MGDHLLLKSHKILEVKKKQHGPSSGTLTQGESFWKVIRPAVMRMVEGTD